VLNVLFGGDCKKKRFYHVVKHVRRSRDWITWVIEAVSANLLKSTAMLSIVTVYNGFWQTDGGVASDRRVLPVQRAGSLPSSSRYAKRRYSWNDALMLWFSENSCFGGALASISIFDYRPNANSISHIAKEDR
jgi:hypothetical protein